MTDLEPYTDMIDIKLDTINSRNLLIEIYLYFIGNVLFLQRISYEIGEAKSSISLYTIHATTKIPYFYNHQFAYEQFR